MSAEPKYRSLEDCWEILDESLGSEPVEDFIHEDFICVYCGRYGDSRDEERTGRGPMHSIPCAEKAYPNG